jgi:hypothetical protein
MTLDFETTIRPKGDVIAIKMRETPTEAASLELGTCVTKVLRAKQMLRADEGYKFQSTITFTPPRIPARRTHIVTIGSSKYVWRNVPASVRLEEDFEVLPKELTQAMSGETRKALGLPHDERVWVSHWLDRSARRTRAEDVEFERHDLPAHGEPGALLPDVPDTDLTRHAPTPIKSAKYKNSRKNRQSFTMLGVLAVSLAIGLWMARSELSG